MIDYLVMNMEEVKTRKYSRKTLSEKRIAEILRTHLVSLGYLVVKELVLNDFHFPIKRLAGKNISKVRIDVAALKDSKITFIEVENGLWVTHPLLYRKFAHRVLLAYPSSYNAPTDEKQIEMARKNGIGIVKINELGSIIPVLKPVDYKIAPYITKSIASLISKIR